MSESQISYPRKRKRTNNPLPSPPSSKRVKYEPHSEIFPPKFWDSLSKIWLTKNALRELIRRNNQAPREPFRGPITRAQTVAQTVTKQSLPIDRTTISAAQHRRDIQKFARRGGPDLSDLISYPEPAPIEPTMSSSRSTSHRKGKGKASSSVSNSKTTAKTTPREERSGKSRSSKASGPEDRNFEQNLREIGVYQYGHEFSDGSIPPVGDDWDNVNEALAAYRASLSPSSFSDRGYQRFVREDAKALDENDVTSKVLPAMLQAMGASNGAQGNKRFTGMERLIEANTQAQPDYYYGANPDQLDPTVRKELKKFIAPQPGLPIAPNFFLEAKGPNGSAAAVKRQSSHNGAIGARAIHALETYGEEDPNYDNTIKAISSSYQDGTLKLYGHSAAQPNGPGTRPEYYMHQMGAYAMTHSRNSFLEGAKALKNGLDMAEGWRNDAITNANSVIGYGAEEEDEEDEAQLYEGEDYEHHGEADLEIPAYQDDTDPDSEVDPDDAEQDWIGTIPTHMTSFAHLTDSTLLSALVEAEDETSEVHFRESETSMDELAIEYAPPPAKRSSTKSHKSNREKRSSGARSGNAKTETRSRKKK